MSENVESTIEYRKEKHWETESVLLLQGNFSWSHSRHNQTDNLYPMLGKNRQIGMQ